MKRAREPIFGIVSIPKWHAVEVCFGRGSRVEVVEAEAAGPELVDLLVLPEQERVLAPAGDPAGRCPLLAAHLRAHALQALEPKKLAGASKTTVHGK